MLLRRAIKRLKSPFDHCVRRRSSWTCAKQQEIAAAPALFQQCQAPLQRSFFTASCAGLPRTRNVVARRPVPVSLEDDNDETGTEERSELSKAEADGSDTDEDPLVPPEVLEMAEKVKFKEDEEEDDEWDVLPTVIILGRPNVGKSSLYNRLVKKKEAVVYNTPGSHVTRDVREGLGSISDMRFKVYDTAGLETTAEEGSVLNRTTKMTGTFVPTCHIALLLIDGRAGLHPLDKEVALWVRRLESPVKVIVVINKAENLYDDVTGSILATVGESYKLGFGDPVPVSAESGAGWTDLYARLSPLVEEARKALEEAKKKEENTGEKPLQFAVAGRPNVGKSTLINALLQKERLLTGPEPGLTRDSIKVDFEYQKRPVYLVDTAGWLPRSQLEEGPASLSAMFTRRSIQRSHVVAIVLDGEEISKTKKAMRQSEVALARWATEEGRALLVIVNKMDLLEGRENAILRDQVMEAVPKEVQLILPQVSGVPVVFVSAIKGRGRNMIMKRAFESYDKWCTRLPTPKLNRWLYKVMARHPQRKDERRAKPRFMTQVKARPPTFIVFVAGFYKLENHELRFIGNSLRDDFNLGGIPLRVIQRTKKELEGV